jgi:dTDP-4-dehydrorhamnose reductase
MKILLLGSNGQLGSDILKVFNENNILLKGFNHQEVEIENLHSVENIITQYTPDLVINTTALHNVEICEENPEKSFAVNAIGPRNLALLSIKYNYRIFHISTDYVFNGTKTSPYTETDLPCPINVYGNSKLSGEYFLLSTSPNSLVIRVSGLYGIQPCRAKSGLNFVRLMLKLARDKGKVKVVTDEYITPTYTVALAEQLLKLSNLNISGLVHCTPQGSCSWFQFASKVFELAKINVDLQIASSTDFPAKVPRPKYSVLDNYRLRELGIDIMPSWEECLNRYLIEIGEI